MHLPFYNKYVNAWLLYKSISSLKWLHFTLLHNGQIVIVRLTNTRHKPNETNRLLFIFSCSFFFIVLSLPQPLVFYFAWLPLSGSDSPLVSWLSSEDLFPKLAKIFPNKFQQSFRSKSRKCAESMVPYPSFATSWQSTAILNHFISSFYFHQLFNLIIWQELR